jgi:hypothetical protein
LKKIIETELSKFHKIQLLKDSTTEESNKKGYLILKTDLLKYSGQTKTLKKEIRMKTDSKTFKTPLNVARKHMKKCSPSLAIKEMQIKTTLRFHLTC